MKKVLWVGDSPDCGSGFGQATKKIVAGLDYRCGGEFDVTVLGINHLGDPPKVPYPVYAAMAAGDVFGVLRLIWMCDVVKPDVIVIQQDGWNLRPYVEQLAKCDEYKKVPIVAIVTVDGLNFVGAWLKGVSLAVFWTRFALDEARRGGYVGPAEVIPLGVDLGVYRPEDKAAARRRRLPKPIDDAFIVGNVNRNQWRKRWDLTLRYFSAWVYGGKPGVGQHSSTRKVQDAYLYMHAAPTGDTSIDAKALATYYGIIDRFILMEPPAFYGVSEDEMRDTYNCFDLCVSTTQGEGFGLTTLEAMACGVACAVPGWSGLGDWAAPAAFVVPCTSVGFPASMIGGVPDEGMFVDALHTAYCFPRALRRQSKAGLELANEPRFRWENIGARHAGVLRSVASGEKIGATRQSEVTVFG